MAPSGDITRLLQKADQGDREAAGQLFGLVANDLRAIVHKRKRSAPPAGDVPTTLLIDEAFCRLVGRNAATWNPGDRRKFFGFASNQIHDLLIKAARSEKAAKRGGACQRVELDDRQMAATNGVAGQDLELLLDLQAALDKFEQFSPEEALLFRLRYFLDCTFEEAAAITGVSATQAKRAYQRARLWLQRELKEYDLDS
jgi:RNA polymerase sigma factor (TIGR02999 family)